MIEAVVPVASAGSLVLWLAQAIVGGAWRSDAWNGRRDHTSEKHRKDWRRDRFDSVRHCHLMSPLIPQFDSLRESGSQ
jgi:hypothetical protein